MKLITVLAWSLMVAATATLAASQSSASDKSGGAKSGAMQVFRLYSQLEEKGNYARIYPLLSSRFKQKLKNESGVKTASDYNRLRLSSEAQWSDFRVIRVDEEQSGLKFVVTANVEESGDKQKVNSTYHLVEDDGKWKIDSWSNE